MSTNMDIHPNDPQTVAEATGHFIGRDLLTALLNATEDGPHPVELLSETFKSVCASQTDGDLRNLAFDGLSTALYAVLVEGVQAIKAKSE